MRTLTFVKARRRATWGQGGVCKTKTRSAAQMVKMAAEFHETKRENAASMATLKHNWPKTYYAMFDLMGGLG